LAETTVKMIHLLGENKRLMFIDEIASKYHKLYQVLNKEEKITIISASELDDSKRNRVLEALQSNPNNSGK